MCLLWEEGAVVLPMIEDSEGCNVAPVRAMRCEGVGER